MATSPVATAPALPHAGRGFARVSLPMPVPVVCATVLSVVGILCLLPTDLFLWALWSTDPLKSIGAFVPPISLLLILRAWRALDWDTRGTWWGLVLLAVTVLTVHLREHAVLELVLSPSWSIFLPPHSLVAFAYGSGVVLLFGGTRLYRAAVFPVCLLWLVNPVPHVFNRFVDLPLQHASAATARAFAHALGQHLLPDQLHLMFTPDFGMFIAPGCNGIRGSVTMGLIALIAGFLYQFRLKTWALVVAAAVVLGYVFNLARLCVLVLYYVAALHLPWLQSRAEMGDYLIGAALFFFATLLLFAVIQRCSVHGDLRLPSLPLGSAPQQQIDSSESYAFSPFRLRLAGFTLLVGWGSAAYARPLLHGDAAIPDRPIFPAAVGQYTLQRTWQERLTTGQTIFDWASYALPGTASVISVGVSPVLGAHDTLLCHVARGENWLWHGSLLLPTTAAPVSFTASFFNDGATQFLEASTVCSGDQCGQYSSSQQQFGLVYSHPDPHTLLSQNPSRPIPVLLRVETLDASLAPELARAHLVTQLRNFTMDASPCYLLGLTEGRKLGSGRASSCLVFAFRCLFSRCLRCCLWLVAERFPVQALGPPARPDQRVLPAQRVPPEAPARLAQRARPAQREAQALPAQLGQREAQVRQALPAQPAQRALLVLLAVPVQQAQRAPPVRPVQREAPGQRVRPARREVPELPE
ncbi:MAG: exosortase J [Janthinobacterium lividum]